MKLTRNIAVALSALAFGAVPAVALASGNTGHGKSTAPGQTKSTSSTSSTTNTSKAKAYGKYCVTASKKHVAGVKGTQFSACVVGAAHAATHPNMSATATCKGDSKKHVAGVKGTQFSACVVGVAKLRSANK